MSIESNTYDSRAPEERNVYSYSENSTMSQQTSNSLINLGDLGKPIDTLIHKISDATGVLYEPTRIRRKAKAESDAAIISAKAEAAEDGIRH